MGAMDSLREGRGDEGVIAPQTAVRSCRSKRTEKHVPKITIADALIECLASRGVRKMFGIPGGDCNLDIIESGQRAGIEFVVTRTENSAAIMASSTNSCCRSG